LGKTFGEARGFGLTNSLPGQQLLARQIKFRIHWQAFPDSAEHLAVKEKIEKRFYQPAFTQKHSRQLKWLW
jgi:aminopeptidase N